MQLMSGILLCLALVACLWLGTALPRNGISKTLGPLRGPCSDGQQCESGDCSCGQCMGCVNDVCFMELCPYLPRNREQRWDISPRTANIP